MFSVVGLTILMSFGIAHIIVGVKSSSFVEDLDAKRAVKRDAEKAERDAEWKDEISSRYSRWGDLTILNVEVIKPEKMQVGAAPTRRGLRPVILLPTENKTKYRVTYTTSYGATTTVTIDYDPSHYGK